ncbi:hypothetical protein C2E23DRAFT_861282 [Lenzites betulinus]|nr:hypothetical protein C2E23DRAFT_861282 [Lenzites betulinus]
MDTESPDHCLYFANARPLRYKSVVALHGALPSFAIMNESVSSDCFYKPTELSMNWTQTEGTAQATASVESNSIKAFTIAAAVSLLCWHYLLTIDKEIEFFWNRRLNGGTILFFANRYITLGYSIYTMIFWVFRPSTKGFVVLKDLVYLEYILESAQYAIWAVLSCLRFYAMRTQRRWAALVLLLSLIPSFAVCFDTNFAQNPVLKYGDGGTDTPNLHTVCPRSDD